MTSTRAYRPILHARPCWIPLDRYAFIADIRIPYEKNPLDFHFWKPAMMSLLRSIALQSPDEWIHECFLLYIYTSTSLCCCGTTSHPKQPLYKFTTRVDKLLSVSTLHTCTSQIRTIWCRCAIIIALMTSHVGFRSCSERSQSSRGHWLKAGDKPTFI